jgi:tripartite-type tricarboxylate transporter receptor subunit TctC
METCARAVPDGYTVCMTDGNIMTLNPYAYAKLPYDPHDFVPVIHFAELEQSVVVHPSLPVKSMRELVEYARANPGQVTWGSAGAGSSMHLYVEWIQVKTGVRFNHILYKGPAPLVQAIAAGEVQATSLTTGTAAPFVRAGKLRPIAMIAGKRRSAFAFDVPSFAEQGFELDFRNWLALVFPKGTPPQLARRWNAEMNRLLADKAFVDKILSSESFTLTGGSSEDMTAIMEKKLKIGAELARITRLRYE